jgi:hypothetical protein
MILTNSPTFKVLNLIYFTSILPQLVVDLVNIFGKCAYMVLESSTPWSLLKLFGFFLISIASLTNR